MKEVLSLINAKKLIKAGDKVGVAVSGGADSMALLHFLNSIKTELDFSVIAITINHKIRQEAKEDVLLVENYCNANNIKVNCFEIDAVKVAQETKESLETAARQVRYGVFNSLLNKKIITKLALAHHKDDQVETILMNLFRGAGAKGIQGMEVARKGCFIRPFLPLSKEEILQYVKKNEIPFAVDKTNLENDYSRNYLRNQILPQITKVWSGVSNAIVNFAEDCAADSFFIEKHVALDGVLVLDKMAKVPVSYFFDDDAIVGRMIFKVLNQIEVFKDIERKHIKLIRDFAVKGETGKKLNLPNKLLLIKEYDFIIFQNKQPQTIELDIPFKVGKFVLEGLGVLVVKKVQKLSQRQEGKLYIDGSKLPKQAKWRFLNSNDIFEKFGGGTKRVKEFLVDKKVPARQRAMLPVLAFENEAFVLAGVELSKKVKLEDDSKQIYEIEFASK